MKPGKAAVSYEVCADIISPSGEVGICVMMELYQRVLDGKGMPDKWPRSELVAIFKETKNVRSLCILSKAFGA